MSGAAKPKHITLVPRHREFLSMLLHGRWAKTRPTLLESFSRKGWTRGEAGGHQLTVLGRQIAELSEPLPPGLEMHLVVEGTRVSLRV